MTAVTAARHDNNDSDESKEESEEESKEESKQEINGSGTRTRMLSLINLCAR